MAGFEDSKIYKVAKVTYEAVNWFKSKAKTLQQSAINTYTANAIENKKMMRSAMRSVKEGLKSFKDTVVNKVEDKTFEAKGLAGKLKGRFNGWMNKLKANAQDKIDTAHYGLLVAKDNAKPILKTATNTFNKTAKNLQTVGKASLNVAAMSVGLTAAGIAKTYEAGSKFVGDKAAQAKNFGEKAVMNGMFMAGMATSKVAKVAGEKATQFKAGAAKVYQSAVNTYTGHAIENKKMMRSAMRSVKEGLTSFKNTVVNKVEDKTFEAKGLAGKLKGRFNGWMNKLKANAQDKIDTAHYGLLVAKDKANILNNAASKLFVKTAKDLQTVGKASLNVAAMSVGLTAAGIAKTYEAGSKFVGDKAAQAKNFGEKAVMNGMFMAGMATSKVAKVAGEKAAQFKAGANKVIMGGVGLANNVVKNIENGSRNVMAKVSNTLTSARTDINKGIAVAKTAVKEQARGNMAQWYKNGYQAGR